MAVDPGDDTYLGDPQSWNTYAYARNNPLTNSDPTGRTVENNATDPSTHNTLDVALRYSPTFQALHADPNVLVRVSNGSLAGVKGGEDGGRSRVVLDGKTGRSVIEVTIDPSLAGAQKASEGRIPTSEVGAPGTVGDITLVEVGVGILMQSDPQGTACVIGNTPPEGHAFAGEREDISETITNEISRGQAAERGHLSLSSSIKAPSYGGSRSRVLIDGVDVSDPVGPTGKTRR